ncbi:MAG TPA: glycosyltransferase family 87 protein [Reyranellaceae bacterium]|nr:glycosyltransferase family 87 protein [Reyranellaceae bacterium]
MTAPTKNDLRLAALVCGIVGLYDVIYVVTTLSRTAVLGYSIDVLFPDFLVFHAAARAFFDGKLAIVYDTDALTHLQNTLYAYRLPFSLGFRPFLYPPLWLLDLLPFGLMPFELALVVFLLATAAACAFALHRIGLRFEAIIAILTAPAAVWVVLAGQNTFLSVALLYAGMALLERRPVLAGILLGVLAYKPQVWVLVPLALLCAREWRALAATALTVTMLGLATLPLFGIGFWLDFLAAAQRASSGEAALEMFERVHAHMTTPLAAAKIAGLGDGVAMALQLVGSFAAVAAVTWAFIRHRPSHARTAVLVTATFLVSPYTLNYDLLLLMPAVTLLFLNPPPGGYLPGERVVHLAAWLIPHFCLGLNAAGLPLTPLVVVAFGAVALMRLGTAR